MSKFDEVVKETEQQIDEKIAGGKRVGMVELFMAPYLGGMTIAFNLNDADGTGIIKINQKELAWQLAQSVDASGAKWGVRSDKNGNVYISLPEKEEE